MCHALLALPVLALPVFWLLPLHLAVPFYVGIGIVSLVFYAYTIMVMRRPRLNGAEGMVGERGRVVELNGVGDEALIVGIQGLELRIRGAPCAHGVLPRDQVSASLQR